MRIEIGDVVIEGTVEELREMGVKFPFEEGASEAENAPKFEVGDYVVPLPEADEEYMVTNTKMKLGKVVYIYEDDEIRIKIIAHENVKEINKEYDVNPKHFRKATDEEIRWAKIGRKPGEFKKGDIVRLLEDSGAHEAGTLVEVHDNGNYKADDSVWVGEFDWYELVVPVEQRFDLAAEAASQ
jgi:hypothetical protein